MTRTDSPHADIVFDAVRSASSAAVSPVAASWCRSALHHGLDPTDGRARELIDAPSLRTLRDAHRPLLDVANPVLDQMFRSVGRSGCGVILSDAHGVILERRIGAGDDAEFSRAGLAMGARWAEAEEGTNGIGTCLFEDRPVVIHRDQHFLAANIGLTCASAPVHDASGDLVAVLDVSTVRSDLGEAIAGLVSHSVTEAARRIEADLFHARYPRARMVLVPGIDRGVGALLAVDVDELVIGATRAARQHLGLSGDLSANPVPVADLLGLDTHERPEDGERAVIARALARAGGNVSAAARALGVSRATLHRKLGR